MYLTKKAFILHPWYPILATLGSGTTRCGSVKRKTGSIASSHDLLRHRLALAHFVDEVIGTEAFHSLTALYSEDREQAIAKSALKVATAHTCALPRPCLGPVPYEPRDIPLNRVSIDGAANGCS